MAPFPREEMEEMVQRWLDANRDAERDGDWAKHLGAFYTEDAEYRWNMGQNREFVAKGRHEICHVALGYHMKGFEKWSYPYHDIIIDEKRGTVIGFYHQIYNDAREDGASFVLDGVSGSWFEYAGNYKWKWERDFFDVGNISSVIFDMAGAGILDPTVRKKIQMQARGNLLPGVMRLRQEPSMCTKINNIFAMVKIVLFG
eukprot:CAMPEP_0195296054 /NCGR_PEP_ID=MMETSP0707-20130614/18704_1 /TAXON_ID=33640 /ORGANISM="Asterionellopsis glacialis, Strain CCMP134" /LENGTH=199 /DNA_ID=CAMNT_0040357445 /DNA_START=123 /DNA_END=722 /DNA_ORIENTATION=+